MEDKDLDKLMDENWSRMSIILDQELPQNKGKKRLVYYWWVGAAIFMTTFLTIGMDDYKTMMLPQKEFVYSEAKSLDAVTSEIADHNQFLNEKQNVSFSGLLKENKVRKFHAENTSTNVNIPKGSNAFRKKQLNEPMAQSGAAQIQHNNSELSKNHQSGNINSQYTNNPNILSEPIDILPSLLSNIVFIDNFKRPHLGITDLKSEFNKWNMGLEINALTHDYSQVMSYSAGLFAELPFKTNWHITGAIRWSRFNYSSPFYSREDIIVAGSSKEIMDATANYILNVEEYQIDPLRREILNGITRYLDYVEFNAGVKYRLTNRLNVTAGITAGVNVNSEYIQDAYIDVLLNNYNEAALTQERINDMGRLHTKYIWRIGAGVEYLLAKRIAITTKADFFIKKIEDRHFDEIDYKPNTLISSHIPNSKLENHNNDNRIGIELGLKYYFR